MSPLELVVMGLIRVIIDAVGQKKAQQLLSQEAKRRANAKADAVAAARILAGR